MLGPLPEHGPFDMEINLVGNKIPPMGPLYQMSEAKMNIVHTYVTDMTKKGLIRASQSPCGAPILFAKKKDADQFLRFLLDVVTRVVLFLNSATKSGYFRKNFGSGSYAVISLDDGVQISYKLKSQTAKFTFSFSVQPESRDGLPSVSSTISLVAHCPPCLLVFFDLFGLIGAYIRWRNYRTAQGNRRSQGNKDISFKEPFSKSLRISSPFLRRFLRPLNVRICCTLVEGNSLLP
ncbi:hypothetical protein PROFUN_09967 [Planoprotostelium fungivorum]|uniref:Uncharacterized protein n=1 Tax=Planoprotostelium fungivorum TaxID=1890364 RepID=A0A2P6NFK5_9EUKA|nr:hypothetical protein PROFUN_09967 [Planoprotostelium fungivorum]